MSRAQKCVQCRLSSYRIHTQTRVPSLCVGHVCLAQDADGRTINRLSHRLRRLNINFPDHSGYTDYDRWLRQEPALSSFTKLLFDSQALYPEYVEREGVVRLWKEHQLGADWADQLCRYATFELWLRQVFCDEFRPNGFSLSTWTTVDQMGEDLESYGPIYESDSDLNP